MLLTCKERCPTLAGAYQPTLCPRTKSTAASTKHDRPLSAKPSLPAQHQRASELTYGGSEPKDLNVYAEPSAPASPASTAQPLPSRPILNSNPLQCGVNPTKRSFAAPDQHREPYLPPWGNELLSWENRKRAQSQPAPRPSAVPVPIDSAIRDASSALPALRQQPLASN